MKCFDKERFFMGQLVGLLMIAFLGIPVIAHAEVTIPHTFSPGTTISSGQVNANFTALKNQMPAVKQSVGPIWITMPTTAAQLKSISVTPPGNGYVIVTTTGTVSVTHTSGTLGYFCLDLHGTADYVGGCGPMSGSDTAVRSYLPSGFPSTGGGQDFGIPYSIVKVFPVSGGASTTFYLNGRATGFDSAHLFHSAMTVLFVPNVLP